MAQRKSYSRYFIILQEDEKGYALTHDKLPTGYVKLELRNDKCKVSYYVQNLKKEDAPYYMILILSKKETNKILKLGELNIDNYGRADVSYEYSCNDLGNTGMSVDNISGAAVSKFLDKNIIPVLSGFLTTDIPKWREFELINMVSETKEEKIENVEKIIEQEVKATKKSESTYNEFDKYEDSIEESKEKIKLEEVSKASNKSNQNTRSDMNDNNVDEKLNKQDEEEITKSEILDNNQEKQEKIIEKDIIEHNDLIDKEDVYISDNTLYDEDTNLFRDYKKQNKKYNKSETKKFFEYIVEDFEEISDNIKDIKRCKWYKAEVNDFDDIYSIKDYNKYTVVYYPMMNYHKYIRKYGHFIIGYKYDKNYKMKYMVYGIPGTKEIKDQPFNGKTGFVTWVPNKKTRADSCEGYWLMFYDFKHSTILIPVK